MRSIDKLLLEASLDSNIQKVIFALNEGADIDVRDKWKGTALHNATLRNYPELVLLLIQRGADINARNRMNNTALSLTPPTTKSAEVLREHGGVL